MKKILCAGFVAGLLMSIGSPALAETAAPKKEALLLTQIQALNNIPEEQLMEKEDPALSILRKLHDLDGPDFLGVRKLLGQASVRSTLNASTRAVLAGVVSPRWDAYQVAGSLWLGGLRSVNPDLREKSRRKMVQFIQPPHIPVLIDLLKSPVSAPAAHAVLQEATGQSFVSDPKIWLTWWNKNKNQVDLVGHLIADTKRKLAQTPVDSFDVEKIWYLPEGLKDKAIPLEQRPLTEQQLVTGWNGLMGSLVKRAVDQWSVARPIIERITHHPDPRVNSFLESMAADPGLGSYASLVLAWRQSKDSLPALREQAKAAPSVSHALAQGSLGDKSALMDLLAVMQMHRQHPMSWMIMDDEVHRNVNALRSVGVIPAETAFELLCHQGFGLDTAETAKQKSKAFDKAKRWLEKNIQRLTFDRRRGYFSVDEKS